MHMFWIGFLTCALIVAVVSFVREAIRLEKNRYEWPKRRPWPRA